MKTAKKPASPPEPADVNGQLVSIAIDANEGVENDNWVGALQNACTKSGVEWPVYAAKRMRGTPDHKPQFSCEVTVLSETKSATSTTKQLSKRAAAMEWVKFWMMQ